MRKPVQINDAIEGQINRDDHGKTEESLQVLMAMDN